jgi:hypothetical protein
LFIADHIFGFGVEHFADLWHLVSAIEVEVELVKVGYVGGEHTVLVVGQTWWGKECGGVGRKI